jgi:hypothetical protein
VKYSFFFYKNFIQRIRSTVDERCQKQMLIELDIVMRENTCPHIIQFYGALFEEVSIPNRFPSFLNRYLFLI